MADAACLRDFWLKSILDQVGDTNGYDDPRSRRWLMSHRTCRLLWDLFSPSGTLPPPRSIASELFGYPIDLDDSAEGAVLLTTGAVSHG